MTSHPVFPLDEMGFQQSAPVTQFMGQPIKSQDDIVPVIQQYLKVSGTDATDSVRKAIDAMVNRPQSRMSQTVLGDISMLVRRMKLPLGREYYLKLQKALESQQTDQDPLTEIVMSPGALADFAQQADRYGVRAGFEAELIFTDIPAGDPEGGDEYNYDEDRNTEDDTTIDELRDFFADVVNRRDRVWTDVLDSYADKAQEKATAYAEREFDEEVDRQFLEEQDENSRLRGILADQGYEEDRVEAIMRAGDAAPVFWSLKDREKYVEENDDYGLYRAAERDMVEQRDAYRDENENRIMDELVEDFFSSDEYTFGRYLQDDNINSFSEFGAQWGLPWPYMEGGEPTPFDETAMEAAAEALGKTVDKTVRVSMGYHQASRTATTYIIEPDSSINPDSDEDGAAEIVSPPMPLSEMVRDLRAVANWAEQHGGYTNRSTGLHIGVSLPDMSKVDYVKLALLVGDRYVLDQFGRSASIYTQSVLDKIAGTTNAQTIAQAVDALKKGLVDVASNALKYTVFRSTGSTDKYVSLNWKGNYVEFRSIGKDYLADMDKVINTVYRYVRALVSADTPDMDRREYLTKLYKIVQGANTNISGPQAEPVNMVITKYLAGDISKEDVVKYKDYLRQAAQARKQPGMTKPTPPDLTPQKRWKVTLDSRTWMIRAPTAGEAVDKVVEQNPELINRYRDFDVVAQDGPQG